MATPALLSQCTVKRTHLACLVKRKGRLSTTLEPLLLQSLASLPCISTQRVRVLLIPCSGKLEAWQQGIAWNTSQIVNVETFNNNTATWMAGDGQACTAPLSALGMQGIGTNSSMLTLTCSAALHTATTLQTHLPFATSARGVNGPNGSKMAPCSTGTIVPYRNSSGHSQ